MRMFGTIEHPYDMAKAISHWILARMNLTGMSVSRESDDLVPLADERLKEHAVMIGK